MCRLPVLALAGLLLLAGADTLAAPSDAQRRMALDVDALVSFGTRHTNSAEDDPARGIGAARRWVVAAMGKLAAASGGRLAVKEISHAVDPIDRPRITKDRITNVVAILPGRDGPGKPPAVVLGAHLDSRVGDLMDADTSAPGAADDASGVVVVLEAMRRLVTTRHDATLIFAVFTGEEEGLVGSRYLAQQLAKDYDLRAMLNLDIVGSSTGRADTIPGVSDQVDTAGTVRCFSAGPDGSPSRRWAQRLYDTLLTAVPDATVELVPKPDRPGRGGDHLSFSDAGVPAARFIQKFENLAHQHQAVRIAGDVEYGDEVRRLDFAYMEKVARLATAAVALGAERP